MVIPIIARMALRKKMGGAVGGLMGGTQNIGGAIKQNVGVVAAGGVAGAGLMTALATGKGSEHKSGGKFIILFAFLLFLADILTEYKGFQIEELGSVFAIFQLIS